MAVRFGVIFIIDDDDKTKDLKNYPPITLPPLQTPVEIEEHRKNTTFDQNYNSLY
ncbi:hypothetical protein [Helicobacter pylori]|uniref:hypothetical protein n=1 Tax=Helicobacter pylori TaxID=210 RepID=UPI0015D67434|nr:hypothetical protein [Helicobacter pylori]